MSKTENAKVKPNRLISIVWILPLITLFVGVWMVIDTLEKRGPLITLTMENADGIEVGKTVVKVRNVEAGTVTDISLNKARTGVDIKVRMKAEIEDLLNDQTQFWIVKPRVDQSGVTGLGTLLSGPYIEFLPGKGKKQVATFALLPEPPITSLSQAGLRLQLTGANSKLLPIGNPVLYRDITVGRIEHAEFSPVDQKIHYQIFIDKPYDQLIGNNTRFWITCGLDITTSAEGIKVRSGPLSSIISGAISFDINSGEPKGDPVKSGSLFTLFADFDSVELNASPRAFYYVTFFEQSVRGLTNGSPVEYQGIRIGSIAQVPYFKKNGSLNLFNEGKIPVLLRIEPERLEVNASEQKKGFWEEKINQAITQRGLIARLQSNNLLTGALYVELGVGEKSAVKVQTTYNDYPVIPSQSAGFAQIEQQLNALLTKFNNLPLDTTVKELNASLSQVNSLAASLNQIASDPETQSMPKTLNKTLQDLRTTLEGISPDSPLYKDVKDTVDSLNETLGTVQPLVRTLNEDPSALIFNRSQKDPKPKGAKP